MNLPENPTGWWISTKLDGCRCILTESGKLLSRNGRDFHPPASFMRGMPQGVRLDGELWMGNGAFPDLVSSIQKRGSDWQGIWFMIFDLAELGQPIESRLASLARLTLPPQAALVPHRVCAGWHDLDSTEAATVANGGEGLCLRAPGSQYRPHGFAKCKRLFPDLDRSILD
jgi:DNA ligase-1